MNVVLLAEAKTDFLDGITWFESISPHLGDQFEFEFYSCINRISATPNILPQTNWALELAG